MSIKVVPAPADQAKRPVRSDKPANQTDSHEAEDKERLAKDDSDEEISVAVVEEGAEEAIASETSLAGEFTFGGALAEAAASSGSLITEAEEADEVGFSQFGDGGGSTILLIGAIALVALGVIVLVDGGGSSNEAPTADADQTVTTDEDTAVDATVTATDPDGDTLTYSAGAAANGTVTGGEGGTFTYTPNADFNGSDSFVVTATDPDGLNATQTVNVTVAAVADPISGPATQEVSTDEDVALNGAVSITDPDAGDTVTYAITAAASSGIVVLAEDGTFTYTPNADYNGSDSFTVSGTSSDGSSADQVVSVTVNPVNDAPVQGALTTTTLNVPQDGSAQFVIDFTDADGDALTASSSDPASGTIDPNTNTYTADAGFLGTDTFDVTVSDGNGGDVTYTVAVNVLEDVVTETSIDVPASGAAVTFDADGGEFLFTDDVSGRTDVILQNFTADDMIELTGVADVDDYSFTSSGGNISITFSDGVDFTQIVLEGGANNPGFVFDYSSAVASLGFDFITIA